MEKQDSPRMKHEIFHANRLRLVATAASFRGPGEPKLRFGDAVNLNSGGPQSIVVDVEGADVTVAWRDDCGDVHEMTLPESCLHRVKT